MDEARRAMVRRLFAMLGRRLEAAAEVAARGEAPALTAAEAVELANRLSLIAQDVAISADAIREICKVAEG